MIPEEYKQAINDFATRGADLYAAMTALFPKNVEGMMLFAMCLRIVKEEHPDLFARAAKDDEVASMVKTWIMAGRPQTEEAFISLLFEHMEGPRQ